MSGKAIGAWCWPNLPASLSIGDERGARGCAAIRARTGKPLGGELCFFLAAAVANAIRRIQRAVEAAIPNVVGEMGVVDARGVGEIDDGASDLAHAVPRAGGEAQRVDAALDEAALRPRHRPWTYTSPARCPILRLRPLQRTRASTVGAPSPGTVGVRARCQPDASLSEMLSETANGLA